MMTRESYEAMKFYCDSCGSKYAIADDKVRGKILKVRCKKCAHIITVREPSAPTQAASASSPTPNRAVAWHYAINGQSFGPFDQEDLVGMYRRGEVADASYVWNETFGAAWKPAFEVEPFSHALRQAQALRPAAKTIGVSGALEAVKLHDVSLPEHEEEGHVPSAQPARPNPFAREPRSPQLSSRLGQLREQLAQDKLDDPPPTPLDLFAQGDPFAASGLKTSKPGLPHVTQPVDSEAVLDVDSAPDATQESLPVFAQAPKLEPTPLKLPELKKPEFKKLDPKKPEPSASLPSFEPDPIAAAPQDDPNDLFASIRADEESSIDFSALEANPFSENPLPPTPAGQREEVFEVSNSLLIQLDEIKKEGRSKRVMLGGLAAIILSCVLGAGLVIWYQNRDAKLTVASSGVVEAHKDDLFIPKYSRDELTTFGGEEILNVSGAEPDVEDPTPQDPSPQEVAVKPDSPKPVKPRPTELAQNDIGAKSSKPNLNLNIPIERGGDSELYKALGSSKSTASSSGDLKTAGADPAKAASMGSSAPIIKGVPAPGPGLNVDARRSNLGSIHKSTSPALDSGSKSASLPPGTLTKEELKEGFNKIRSSVSSCYQHHTRRGLPFDSPKIKVQVEIVGTGKVSNVSFTPSDLSTTEFGRCMDTRRSSWSFRAYEGQSIRVEHTYVLQ